MAAHVYAASTSTRRTNCSASAQARSTHNGTRQTITNLPPSDVAREVVIRVTTTGANSMGLFLFNGNLFGMLAHCSEGILRAAGEHIANRHTAENSKPAET